jgi:hypothetical protein
MAALMAGCVDGGETPRVSQQLVDAVQVSKSEPGSACRPIGALEGKSGDCGSSAYESAYDNLRAMAALRGGNYFVIDAVDGPRLVSPSYYDTSVVIRGRLFACALGQPYGAALASTPVVGPPVVAPMPMLAPSQLTWSATPVVATSACEPDCSPGFVCSHGACVQACNPACLGGQRCGEDRICH